MGVYRIEKHNDDLFYLYEHDNLLTSFSRSSFRDDLTECAIQFYKSQNWIGSILRIFNSRFPAPARAYVHSTEDQLRAYSDATLAEYLKSKGFRVVRQMPVLDADIVKHLESRGYTVEGLLDNCYYSTVEAAGVK